MCCWWIPGMQGPLPNPSPWQTALSRCRILRRGFVHWASTPPPYYVLCSYSHATDCASLHAVLDKQWSYAGMVGSRAKIGAIFSQMRELGYSDARLAEVHTPIGLALGGETPAEIAVAIMAEIIAVQHGKIQNFS